eukprot:g7357.t1
MQQKKKKKAEKKVITSNNLSKDLKNKNNDIVSSPSASSDTRCKISDDINGIIDTNEHVNDEIHNTNTTAIITQSETVHLEEQPKESVPVNKMKEVSDEEEVATTSSFVSQKEECPNDESVQYDSKTGLSLYEQRRLENIERNKRILASLGLGDAKSAMSTALQKQKKKKVKELATRKRKKIDRKTVSTRPVRRSRRQQQQQQNISYNENDLEKNISNSNSSANNNGFGTTLQVVEEPKEEELPFDISNVFAYSCYDKGNYNDDNSTAIKNEKLTLPSTAAFTSETTMKRLKNVGNNEKYFSDPKLKKVYSISFQQVEQPDVFIAGGHGGMVSAFGIHDIVRTFDDEENEEYPSDFIEPLMSFKAHSGWISTVQLINSVHSNKEHVLMTASNDAVLTLWDMTKQLNTDRKKDVRPKILATNNNLHNNGIFSAHEKNGKIVTGSKDKSVVVSKIHEEGKGILPLHEYCFHTGVVKSASFRDENVIASGGNDSIIFIYDIRVEKGLTRQSDDDAHHFAINSISWHPTEEHSLISADFGNTINVWDLRNFKNPVKQLKGHSHIYDNQRGSIYHPCFVANGRNVLTNGAKTDTLSIFDFESGVLESKGSVDIGNVECVGINGIWGTLIACSRGNKIQLMQGEFS